MQEYQNSNDAELDDLSAELKQMEELIKQSEKK
jgi:hypothetical protein